MILGSISETANTITTREVNFHFYKQCSQGATRLLANEPFLRKMLVSFFSSNIRLYIEKNPVEKLCKDLKIKLNRFRENQI